MKGKTIKSGEGYRKMDYAGILIPLAIVLIFIAVMSFIYKDKEKVDKGFKVNFFRLSYRRRMIQSLFSILFVIAAFILAYIMELFTLQILMALVVISVVGGAIELAYNYRMWKKHGGSGSIFSENGN
ncbi:hypothetical protein DP120_00110 [Planococcus halotolerans]|uniref:Uncharacterized protein n=1 Tax=Planococcus halotolerans TaxID=2233542 RepID=A0A365L5P0_9BACL|nr:hypothetical protein DP120_00110 [Planococcus halotolerans]